MSKYFGAHVSIAGGVENAPLNAGKLGATAFALFTKNQRQWAAPPLSEESIQCFLENCATYHFTPAQILPHDSYLINLGQPDDTKHRSAVAAFTDEMRRCEALKLKYLNFHPGSHLNQIPLDDCLKRIAEGVQSALSATHGVTAVIENTAGQGTNVGFAFEQLARLIELIGNEFADRTGVCLDTCHTFAAGYDIDTAEKYQQLMRTFDRIVGLNKLCAMHLNDAKAPVNSHLDRHAPLGEGTLGWELFRSIAQDPRLDGIPLILETPDDTRWASEISTLQNFATMSEH